jgi:hemerythrin superfamily protein
MAALADVAIAQDRRTLAPFADRDELLALALIVRHVPFAPDRHTGNSYSKNRKMVDITILGARVRDALRLVVRESGACAAMHESPLRGDSADRALAHKLHYEVHWQQKDPSMPKMSRPATKPPSVRHVRRAAGIEEPKNALELLRADHREVEKLFRAFKRAGSADEQQTLAKAICTALTIHARIEEEIFYPAFIEATGNKELHAEAIVEHEGAKRLIADIESSAAGDDLFEARVNVLSEMIKHHVKEEERFNGMFAKARRAGMNLLAVGVLLEARKQELEGKPQARAARQPLKAPPELVGAAELARRPRKAPARRAPL